MSTRGNGHQVWGASATCWRRCCAAVAPSHLEAERLEAVPVKSEGSQEGPRGPFLTLASRPISPLCEIPCARQKRPHGRNDCEFNRSQW